jgi:hypothetical protein
MKFLFLSVLPFAANLVSARPTQPPSELDHSLDKVSENTPKQKEIDTEAQKFFADADFDFNASNLPLELNAGIGPEDSYNATRISVADHSVPGLDAVLSTLPEEAKEEEPEEVKSIGHAKGEEPKDSGLDAVLSTLPKEGKEEGPEEVKSIGNAKLIPNPVQGTNIFTDAPQFDPQTLKFFNDEGLPTGLFADINEETDPSVYSTNLEIDFADYDISSRYSLIPNPVQGTNTDEYTPRFDAQTLKFFNDEGLPTGLFADLNEETDPSVYSTNLEIDFADFDFVSRQ